MEEIFRVLKPRPFFILIRIPITCHWPKSLPCRSYPTGPLPWFLGKTMIRSFKKPLVSKFAADHVFSDKEIRDALEEPLTAKRRLVPALLPQLS